MKRSSSHCPFDFMRDAKIFIMLRYRTRKYSLAIIGFIFFYFSLALPSAAQNMSSLGERLQFDFQGESHFSRYNFTDIKIPYNGVDTWAEFKLAAWLNNNQSFAPYISIIPSFTSEGEFWWQKNAQFAVGLQWYPFPAHTSYFRGIRFYSLWAYRSYFSEPEGLDQQDTDLQIGIDYYYDNLFDSGIIASVAWSNGGYRKTNFCFPDYSAFLWMGNIKAGIKTHKRGSIWMGYLVLEWTYSPKHKKFWQENFLRTGAGVRFYPWAKKGDTLIDDFLHRLYLYVEFLQNAAWLGEAPSAERVKKSDFRIGLGFSSGGFFRDKQKH